MEDIMKAIINVCAPLLTAAVSYGIYQLAAIGKQYVKTAYGQRCLDEVAQAAVNAVESVNQTYVDALKEQNVFDEAAQKEAFNMAMEAAKASLSASAKQFVEENIGDLTEYLTTLIEAQVRSQKGISVTAPANKRA